MDNGNINIYSVPALSQQFSKVFSKKIKIIVNFYIIDQCMWCTKALPWVILLGSLASHSTLSDFVSVMKFYFYKNANSKLLVRLDEFLAKESLK